MNKIEILFTVLLFLVNVNINSQIPYPLRDLSFEMSSKFDSSGTSRFINVSYDSAVKDYKIFFKNASPTAVLDTLARFQKCSYTYNVHKIPPIICNGTFSLGNIHELIWRICGKFHWDFEQFGKTRKIKDERIYYDDLFLLYPYTADLVKCDSAFTSISFDNIRNRFVITFRGVSPYDILKIQARENGYNLNITYPERPLPTVSGTLPLYIDAKTLLYHFCFLHRQYSCDEGKNKYSIMPYVKDGYQF